MNEWNNNDQPYPYDNNQPTDGYPQYYNPYGYANPQIPNGPAQSANPPVSKDRKSVV